MSTIRKRCAVCGETSPCNVIHLWKRDKDNKMFNICSLCREAGKVNAQSVENYAHYKGAVSDEEFDPAKHELEIKNTYNRPCRGEIYYKTTPLHV